MKQLNLLGVNCLVKGWKRRIIGTDVPKSNIDSFLSLKDAHLPKLLSPTYYI